MKKQWKWSDNVIETCSNRYTVFYVLLIAVVLTACGSLTQSDKPAVTTWWLKPYVGVPQAAVPDPALPVALTLSVVPGLDSEQILTLSNDAELRPYAGARWVDHAPELLASLIGRSLDASGRYEVFPAHADSGSGGCDLQLELREFFADIGSQGATTGVRVAIHGRFQCKSAAPVIVQSCASIPVRGEVMHDIVAAFQAAMDQVMEGLLASMIATQPVAHSDCQ